MQPQDSGTKSYSLTDQRQFLFAKSLNSSGELSGVVSFLAEAEIRDKLRDQRVVGVHLVTVENDGKVVPINTLFLTFNNPILPKEIKVGYLHARVKLGVPISAWPYEHYVQVNCKTSVRFARDQHNGQCDGPQNCLDFRDPRDSSAKDCPALMNYMEM